MEATASGWKEEKSKGTAKRKGKAKASSKKLAKSGGESEEDKKRNKSAVTIQKSIRGVIARIKVINIRSNNRQDGLSSMHPCTSEEPRGTMENATAPTGDALEGMSSSSSKAASTTPSKGMQEIANDKANYGAKQSIVVDGGKLPLSVVQAILIFLSVLLPNMIILLMFSHAGSGLDFYNSVSPRKMDLAGTGLAFFAACIACMYYILDWVLWAPLFQALSLVPLTALVAGSTFLKARNYPWAPLIMILFFIPIACGTLRKTSCKSVLRPHFFMCFSVSAYISATMLLLIWLIWMADGHKWNDATKLKMAEGAPKLWQAYKVDQEPLLNNAERDLNYAMDCGPNKDVARFSSEAKTDIGTRCKKAMTVLFTCYTSPLIGFLVNSFLGFFALLNGVVMKLQGSSDVARLEGMLKRFLSLLVLVMMGMYFSASMSGASVQLGSTLMAFFAAALTVLMVSMYVELGRDNVKNHMQKSRLSKMLLSAWGSDWARALFIGGFNMMLPIFLVMNLLKQKWKKCRGTALDDDKFTPVGRKLVNELYTWNWASILLKICLLGELFFTFQVGVAKATYIFLSKLNSIMSSWNYGVVIVSIFFIGYMGFLLPPVPGVPVYVFTGIVVAEQGRQLESVGFGLGCVIACALAWTLKLAASTGQYGIGYMLGKKVGVQALIGVDKVPTRAIEQILNVPGMTVGKVSVLVGGPDWPTSVTCGILKLNIPQMLIGTAPVFFVSSPCVLAGAFLGRVVVGEDSIWSALAGTFTGLAVAGQAGCGLMAVGAITKVIENDGERLAQPRPEHAAVAALTKSQEELSAIYDRVTDFKTLAFWRRATISIAAWCQLFSGFLFAMGGEYCFRPFAVSSNIDAPYEENGLCKADCYLASGELGSNGNPFNIVRDPGKGALGLFALGVVLHVFFSKDTQRLAAQEKKNMGGDPESQAEVPKADLIGNQEPPQV